MSEWAEILRGFMKYWIKGILKISDFYLDQQKSFIPKNVLSVPCTMDNSCFSLQIAPWCPNFPHQRLCHKWIFLILWVLFEEMQHIYLDKEVEKLKIGLFKKLKVTFQKLCLFRVPMIRYLKRLEGKIIKCLFFYVKIF